MLRVILFISLLILSEEHCHASIHFGANSSENSSTRIEITDSISPQLKSINVVTGIPLTSEQDKNGGFGDVAANVISALNLKKKYPNLTVNLLVTSRTFERREGVRTSNEILKIMIPELNLDIKDKPQAYKGIQIYFLSKSFDDLDRIAFDDPYVKKLPKTDLTVQFAGNDAVLRKLISQLSPVHFSFYEFASLKEVPWVYPSSFLIANKSPTISLVEKRFINFGSGPSAFGYYSSQDKNISIEQRHEILSSWLGSEYSQIFSADNKIKIAFAYSGSQESTLNYASALIQLSQKNPGEKYVLFARRFTSLNELSPPPNLLIKTFKSFPNEVMHNLIYLSDLPPLVTGDSSLSIALSSLKEKKRLFMYESPPWKHEFINDYIDSLISKTNVNKEVLSNYEIDLIRSCMNYNSPDNSQLVDKTLVDNALRFFESEETRNKLSETIVSESNTKDIYRNTKLAYEFFYLFQSEIKSEIFNSTIELIPKLISQGSWRKLINFMTDILESPKYSLNEKTFSLILLAKFDGFSRFAKISTELLNELYHSQPRLYQIVRVHAIINEKNLAPLFNSNTLLKKDFNEFLQKVRIMKGTNQSQKNNSFSCKAIF